LFENSCAQRVRTAIELRNRRHRLALRRRHRVAEVLKCVVPESSGIAADSRNSPRRFSRW
jgi:hypothetical protein